MSTLARKPPVAPIVAALLIVVAAAARADEPNPIFKQLVDQGIDVGGGERVRLPAPTLADGLSASAERQAINSIADENHPVAALVRKAVVAPFVLKISDEKPVAGAQPRRVDLWFVAYGELAAMTEEAFLRQQVAAGGKGEEQEDTRTEILSGGELRARNIAGDPSERYLAADVRLFDRVELTGVMRARLTRSDDSVIVAAALDPRFAGDAKYPNAWRSLRRDEAGKLTAGRRQPYSAAGWYAKATRLAEPAGAVLIEYHLAFDEPAGWFNGANLLRSKLPILVQDAVRSLRRKLAEGSK